VAVAEARPGAAVHGVADQLWQPSWDRPAQIHLRARQTADPPSRFGPTISSGQTATAESPSFRRDGLRPAVALGKGQPEPTELSS
jgi:hypothetical protein